MLEETAELTLEKKNEFCEQNNTEEKEMTSNKSKNFIPKIVRSLMRRKKKLSDRLMSSKNWEKNYKVSQELEGVEEELTLHYNARRKKEEEEAIEEIKKNPKFFFSYAKRFSKTKDSIETFIMEDGRLVTDPTEQAEMLREQYDSVSSDPRKEFQINDPSTFFMGDLASTEESLPKCLRNWRMGSLKNVVFLQGGWKSWEVMGVVTVKLSWCMSAGRTRHSCQPPGTLRNSSQLAWTISSGTGKTLQKRLKQFPMDLPVGQMEYQW